MLTAMVLAAGQSRRMGKLGDKTMVPLAGHPLIVHSVAVLSSLPEVTDIVLVGSAVRCAALRELVAHYEFTKVRSVVAGGATRQESVSRGLAAIDWPARHIAVHDAARPCLAKAEASAVIADGLAYGAAILGTPLVDTIKKVECGIVTANVERSALWAVQTPQVFRREWLEAGHAQAHKVQGPITDDAVLVAAAGYEVRITLGSAANLKVTTAVDLQLANFYLERGDRLCL